MTKRNRPPNSRLKSAGFTLVELMVTVAIIAIVAGLTFGNMNTASYRLKTTAKTVNGEMQRARLLAVKENCPVYVDFDFDDDGNIDSGFTIWKDINNNGTYNDATTDNNGDGTIDNLDEELIATTKFNRIACGTVAVADGGPANGPSGTPPPADGVSFSGNRLRFSPQGTSSSGWVYLCVPENTEAGTYAVGTNNIGRVRSFYYATEGGSWN